MRAARLTLIACALALSVACGASLIHRTALAVDQLVTVTSHLQDAEIALHDAGIISAADHRRWQESFLRIGLGTQHLVAALRAGDGAAIQRQIRAVIDLLDELERDQVVTLSPERQGLFRSLLVAARTTLLVMSAA